MPDAMCDGWRSDDHRQEDECVRFKPRDKMTACFGLVHFSRRIQAVKQGKSKFGLQDEAH